MRDPIKISKLKLIFTIILVMSVLQAYTQLWDNYYGEPMRSDFAETVIETYDKGYLICGRVAYNWSWLIKTDMNGDTLWEKVIECDGKNAAFSVAQTPDGDIIVVGQASIFENIVDPFILKFNACGENEWCTILRKPGQLAYAKKVLVQEDGSLLVLTYNMGSPGGHGIHIYNFSEAGILLWRNVYATADNYPLMASPLPYNMYCTNDGGLMITGSCYYPDINNPNGIKGLRPMYIKVDMYGNEEWMLPFGYSLGVFGVSSHFIELENGNFWGLGTRRNDPLPIKPMLMKFSSVGYEQDFITIDSDTLFNNCLVSTFEYGYLINDSILITGGPFRYDDYEPGNWGEIIVDSNGNVYKTRKHLDNVYPYSMNPTSNGKYIITANALEEGQTSKTDIHVFKIDQNLEFDSISDTPHTYDSLCNEPIQSGYIYLDDCDVIVGMDEIPTPQEYQTFLSTIPISIYPNPTGNEVNFVLENTKHHTNIVLMCYDLVGRKVYETTLIRGQKGVSTSVIRWPAGLYVAVVTSRGMVVGKGKFVVQN